MSNDRQEVLYGCKFILVEFQDDCQSGNKLLPIELVPKTWVKVVEGEYFCKYPPEKDFEYVEEWTKQAKDPERSWKSYPVTLFHGAADFNQGKRRLERAYQTRNCASTDGEKKKSSIKDDVISNSDLHQMLRIKTSMNVSPNDGETGSETDSASHKWRLQGTKPKQSTSSKKMSRNRHKISDDSSDSEASTDSPYLPIRNSQKESQEGSKQSASRSKTNPHSKIASIDNIDPSETAEPAEPASPSNVKNNKFHLEGTGNSQRFREGRNQRSKGDGHQSMSSEDLELELHTTSKTVKEINVNKQNDAFVEMMLENFASLESCINQKLKSVKNSILYNIEHKLEELKLAIVASNIARVPHETVDTLIKSVNTPLPIASLNDFLEFDKAVSEEQEKKDALIALFNFLCFEHTTAQKCIDNALPRIFRKEVQGKYSGQGKKVKGVGKLDFSATATFTCFEEAIRTKFGDSDESKGLKSKIGIWLSHFGDREGGRKERCVFESSA